MAKPTDSFYLDAHLHLQDIPPQRTEEILAHCRTENIGALWVNATSPVDWPPVAALARAHPKVLPFFGLHPWHTGSGEAASATGWLPELEQLLAEFPTAGIGEAGLDRRRPGLSAPAQEQALRRQLELARRFNRPICLHGVGAADWLLQVLKTCPPPEAGFLLHGFAGTEADYRQFARLGAYFSFSPRLLQPQQDKLRNLCALVVTDRLLLETDAPYGPLPPPDHSSADGAAPGLDFATPLDIIPLYAAAARLRNAPLPEFRAQLAENARRLLSFAPQNRAK